MHTRQSFSGLFTKLRIEKDESRGDSCRKHRMRQPNASSLFLGYFADVGHLLLILSIIPQRRS